MEMELTQQAQTLRQEAKALREQAKAKLDLAQRCEAEAAHPSPQPETLPDCAVCGKPVEPWGIPGTLQGCHRYLALIDGKVKRHFFGAVHEDCDRKDWAARLEDAAQRGWLLKVDDGRYEVAEQYRP